MKWSDIKYVPFKAWMAVLAIGAIVVASLAQAKWGP
jgi:hypothetical protein